MKESMYERAMRLRRERHPVKYFLRDVKGLAMETAQFGAQKAMQVGEHVSKHKGPYGLAAGAVIGASAVALGKRSAKEGEGVPMSKAGSVMEKMAINWVGLGSKALDWTAKHPQATNAIGRGLVGAGVGATASKMSGVGGTSSAITGGILGAGSSFLPIKSISEALQKFKIPNPQLNLF
jgi:L-aminopeptidase/D-esterase-like protein